MSDRRVVLGIGYSQGMDLGALIESEMEEKGIGDVECVLAHTKSAVETFLRRDSSIIGVILLRDISVSSPYTARELVDLAESYPDIVFVPVCVETYKSSGFAQELLDGGVYNMVFNCDSSLQTLTGRIIKPYGRREARRYYGLVGESERRTSVSEDNVGLSDENYYSYLEFLQGEEGAFSDKLNYIKGILDSTTFTTLLLRLPDELKDKVSCEQGYENFYSNVEKRSSAKKDEKKKKKPEPEKEAKVKSEGDRVFTRMAAAGVSLFKEVNSGIKAMLEDGVQNGGIKGLGRLFARSKKEFDLLENALIDELSLDERVECLPEGKAQADGSKTVVRVSEAVVLEEESKAVTGEPSREAVGLQEVVVLNEELVESALSAGEVRASDSRKAETCEVVSEQVAKKPDRKSRVKREKKVEKKVKEERVKSVYIGSVVIAVASIKKGIGCSHVARMFANYMFQVEKRHTCFIDCEKALYAPPEGLFSGIDVLSLSELALAYNRYDCIVMDVGTDYKRFSQEIMRATVKVMCCTADDAVVESVYKFMGQDPQPDAWIYAYNHAHAKAKRKRVEELMEDYKYLLIPACDEECLEKAFVKEIKRVLVGMTRRKQHAMAN